MGSYSIVPRATVPQYSYIFRPLGNPLWLRNRDAVCWTWTLRRILMVYSRPWACLPGFLPEHLYYLPTGQRWLPSTHKNTRLVSALATQTRVSKRNPPTARVIQLISWDRHNMTADVRGVNHICDNFLEVPGPDQPHVHLELIVEDIQRMVSAFIPV